MPITEETLSSADDFCIVEVIYMGKIKVKSGFRVVLADAGIGFSYHEDDVKYDPKEGFYWARSPQYRKGKNIVFKWKYEE